MGTRFYSNAEYGSSRINLDADTVYFSADIINNQTADPVNNQDDPQVNIYTQRQFPVLQDANDYMLSCLRLTTSGATRNLPMWIPRIQTATVYARWEASISGTTMTVNRLLSGSIGLNQIIGGSGTAVIPLPGGGTANVLVSLDEDVGGNPITIAGAPGAPITYPATYVLSGVLPPVVVEGVTYYTYDVINASVFIGQPQKNPNLTIYSFTLENGALSSQVFLEWIPENKATPPPNAAELDANDVYVPGSGTDIVVQNLESDYYYGYTYANFLIMANTALRQATVDVGLLANQAPILNAINASSSPTLSNSFGVIFEMTQSTAGAINIYMNSNMESLLPNFHVDFVNMSNGRTSLFNFTNPQNPTAVITRLVQEYSGTSAWSPCDALVVTTSAIPVVPEQVSAPGFVGNSNRGIGSPTTPAAFQAIVADISISEISGAEDWRKDIIWQPTAEFLMVSLTNTSSPISIIDLAVWWRNRYDNNLYPLRLVNGSSVSVKLMFRRKQMGV